MNTEGHKTSNEKEHWETPELNLLDVEAHTEGAPAGDLSGDALGYS